MASSNRNRLPGRFRQVVSLGLGAAATLLLTLSLDAPSATASAHLISADEKTPTISIVGSDSLEVELKPATGTTDTDDFLANLHVNLITSSPTDVVPAFELVPVGPIWSCSGFQETGDGPAGIRAADGQKPFDLSFQTDRECVGVPLTLVVSSPSTAPITAKVATARSITFRNYGPPFVVALLAGLFYNLVGRRIYREQKEYRTPTSSSWTFSGSWLTSIAALGTALAGVLTASGFTGELLPGVPLGNFLGLSLTFALLIVAAPMVFTSYQVTDLVGVAPTVGKPDQPQPSIPVTKGRVVGLISAGSLTCAGVAGQLLLLVELTWLSNAGFLSQLVVTSMLLAAATIAAIYVAASTKQAVALSVGENTPTSPNNGFDIHAMDIRRRFSSTSLSGTF